ncbi:hypothetical protein K438DRAFT_1770827 [Mycena galopus ATCC 62051]|nr:hypothetical protein K438DRAFT_1770827 [Mycena galopus ATCC 62051]
MFFCSVDKLGPSIERTSFQEPLSGEYTIFNPTWGPSALQVKDIWGFSVSAIRSCPRLPRSITMDYLLDRGMTLIFPQWIIEPRGDEYPDEYTMNNEFEKPVCVFFSSAFALCPTVAGKRADAFIPERLKISRMTITRQYILPNVYYATSTTGAPNCRLGKFNAVFQRVLPQPGGI